MNILKRLLCDHKGKVIYDGIEGGTGFLWRKMHCKNCMKKYTSLTYVNSANDNYSKGQKLTRGDCEIFNNEVR
tara:strand:- start:1626 stop:1844 length:219 start_codon:yes stop_codon:yes gene_type:complete